MKWLLLTWCTTTLPMAWAASRYMRAESNGLAQLAAGMAATGNVRVQLQTPSRWPMPDVATDTSTWLRVVLTNDTRQVLRFDMLDSLHPALAGAGDDGPALLQHGRDALRRATRMAGPVTPGSTHVSHHRVLLRRMASGAQIRIEDGFGGWWWTGPVTPGLWRLSVVMDRRTIDAETLAGEVAIWSGRIQSPAVSILL